jgi:hypothetical protein
MILLDAVVQILALANAIDNLAPCLERSCSRFSASHETIVSRVGLTRRQSRTAVVLGNSRVQYAGCDNWAQTVSFHELPTPAVGLDKRKAGEPGAVVQFYVEPRKQVRWVTGVLITLPNGVSYRIDPTTDAAKPLRNHWAPAAALLGRDGPKLLGSKVVRRTIRVAAA